MNRAGRIVAQVRRRLYLVRFLNRVQVYGAVLAAVAFAAALAFRFFSDSVPSSILMAVALLVAVGIALRGPVRESLAASEADRILKTRERISTALAVETGRAADPLGFYERLEKEVGRVESRGLDQRIAVGLPLPFCRLTIATIVLLLGVFLAPLIPLPSAGAGEETVETARERERVAEGLRKLERKLARREIRATEMERRELAEMLKTLRQDVARLAGEQPSRAPAMAELSRMERDAKDAARELAGMKAKDPDESQAEENRTLNELAKALKNLEEADMKAAKEKFSALWDKLNQEAADSLSAAETQSMLESMEQLQRALGELSEAAAGSGDLSRMLEGLAGSEQMAKLAEAMEKLRQALAEKGMTPEEQEALEEALRNYKMLQLTDEEIAEMMKAIEDLLEMLASGQDISFCKGGMGGLRLLGGAGGMPGLGLIPGQGPWGPGNSQRDGMGFGGPGRGRGGRVPESDDGKKTRPDLVPGMVGGDGKVTLIRTVRSMPSPEDAPAEYETLIREATREAQEAIRRGEIPRRYRGAVRRYFSGPEDE